MPDDNDGVVQLKGRTSLFGQFLMFLNKAIRMLQPADLFGDTTINSNEWFVLQTSASKDTLAAINVFTEAHPNQPKIGEIVHNVGLLITLIKARFSSEAWNDFNKDVGKRIKRLRDEAQRIKYTPFTIPRGQWLRTNAKGPIPHNENAITALKYHLEDEGITVAYDHWKNSVSVTNVKKSKFPRESKDFLVKNYINQLVAKFNILFTIEEITFGLGQLAANNARHSMLDYFAGLKWDGTTRLRKLLTEIMKFDGTDLQLSVITKQLVASVRRVKFPGAKYDMCPLLISKEGFNKSTFLMVLYGRRNVLAEDILDLTAKEQSEKLRNGIMCVEFADTLGDEKKSDARKIKAFITRQDDVGRDAYGRVEDVEHVGRTNVYWHTGNNPHLLTSEEGNRRFLPLYIPEMIDINLLRQERDQIWAEVVELERIGRLDYEAEMRSKNIPINPDDEVYPDIMLEEKYWPQASVLQDQAKKKTGYEDLLANIIFWPDVFWEPPKNNHCSISILSQTIKERLDIPDWRWNAEAQKIARVMRAKVELHISDDGVPFDVHWIKVDNLKKGNSNIPLNGYSIRLNGDRGCYAYHLLQEKKKEWDENMEHIF